MVVCRCKRVREREIRNRVREGALTVRALSRTTGAGKACGGCHLALRQIIESERSQEASGELPLLADLEAAR